MSDLSRAVRVVTVGHVDHGKSTLLGRLFHDLGLFPQEKFKAIEKICKDQKRPFEWAYLFDAFAEERHQGVTIDLAQVRLLTNELNLLFIDAPGHKEFLKNMISGAANADAALVLLDAQEGIEEQSRRHGQLLNLLGLRQIIVIVNKMDLVKYSEEKYQSIVEDYTKFLKKLNSDLSPLQFIPVNSRDGENIVSSSKKMKWYDGGSLLSWLIKLKRPAASSHLLRFPVQDVYKQNESRIIVGRVESGRVQVGDTIFVNSSGETSTVLKIARWSAIENDVAELGESIGLILQDKLFIERGNVLSHVEAPPTFSNKVKCKLFWMGKNPLIMGKNCQFKLATQQVSCRVLKFHEIINGSTLEIMSSNDFLRSGDVATATLELDSSVSFDLHASIPEMGRFVLTDTGVVSGGGVIDEQAYPDRRERASQSENVTWFEGSVTQEAREAVQKNKGAVVWLTGFSGAGKSTIAAALERELFDSGIRVYTLDGDNVRHGLNADLSFSPNDRAENIRRVGEVAKLFADAGIVVICSFISPYRFDREQIRAKFTKDRFFEVFVDCPIGECQKRDPKGLYAKAQNNELSDLTGVSSPYEAPESPEEHLETDKLDVQGCVQRLIKLLKLHKVI